MMSARIGFLRCLLLGGEEEEKECFRGAVAALRLDIDDRACWGDFVK